MELVARQRVPAGCADVKAVVGVLGYSESGYKLLFNGDPARLPPVVAVYTYSPIDGREKERTGAGAGAGGGGGGGDAC